MFFAVDNNDLNVLMESLNNLEAFSIANLQKQEEIFANILEILQDERFESEAHYQEQRSLEEQPTFILTDSNDSTVFMKNLNNLEAFLVINHEKQEESSINAFEILKDDKIENEVDFQEHTSLFKSNPCLFLLTILSNYVDGESKQHKAILNDQ